MARTVLYCISTNECQKSTRPVRNYENSPLNRKSCASPFNRALARLVRCTTHPCHQFSHISLSSRDQGKLECTHVDIVHDKDKNDYRHKSQIQLSYQSPLRRRPHVVT